jgi:hypothetical protein
VDREEPKNWITGAEFGEARRQLILADRGDSPEMDALLQRVRERDNYLWDTYAKPLIEEHRDEWAAVSLEGEMIFGKTASEIISTATEKFGESNFVYGRMAEFRGRFWGGGSITLLDRHT